MISRCTMIEAEKLIFRSRNLELRSSLARCSALWYGVSNYAISSSSQT